MTFIRENRLPAQLFSVYAWGGYELWRLYPEYRMFMDGRTHVYGPDVLKEFLDVVNVSPRWQAVLDKWQVQTILALRASPLSGDAPGPGRLAPGVHRARGRRLRPGDRCEPAAPGAPGPAVPRGRRRRAGGGRRAMAPAAPPRDAAGAWPGRPAWRGSDDRARRGRRRPGRGRERRRRARAGAVPARPDGGPEVAQPVSGRERDRLDLGPAAPPLAGGLLPAGALLSPSRGARPLRLGRAGHPHRRARAGGLPVRPGEPRDPGARDRCSPSRSGSSRPSSSS